MSLKPNADFNVAIVGAGYANPPLAQRRALRPFEFTALEASLRLSGSKRNGRLAILWWACVLRECHKEFK
jgi:hypothetical protein